MAACVRLTPSKPCRDKAFATDGAKSALPAAAGNGSDSPSGWPRPRTTDTLAFGRALRSGMSHDATEAADGTAREPSAAIE